MGLLEIQAIAQTLESETPSGGSATKPRIQVTGASTVAGLLTAPTVELPTHVSFADVKKATDLILPYGITAQEMNGGHFSNVLNFYTLLARVHPLGKSI